MKVNNPKKQPRHLVHSSGSGVAFDCIILLFFLFTHILSFYKEYGVIEYLKGLYSVYDRMYSLCAVCSPNGFYSVCSQCAACMLQRFISVYCQFVFLSGVCATTDVGRTFRREFTLVREVRNIAVSRRLRKTDWCFYSVFV